MDIRNMVKYLVNKGLTEHAIAKAVCVHQSTVSRILSGRIKDPRGSIALGIVALFEAEQQKNSKYIAYKREGASTWN